MLRQPAAPGNGPDKHKPGPRLLVPEFVDSGQGASPTVAANSSNSHGKGCSPLSSMKRLRGGRRNRHCSVRPARIGPAAAGLQERSMIALEISDHAEQASCGAEVCFCQCCTCNRRLQQSSQACAPAVSKRITQVYRPAGNLNAVVSSQQQACQHLQFLLGSSQNA